jgi:16S rRNA (cytidine1402-2'-O)-methyltransferase
MVRAAPGASALLAALAVAGLPTDRFAFLGFAPTVAGARRRFVAEALALAMTVVIYESPRRVHRMLADCVQTAEDRPAALCRELTKRFEEVRRGTLGELAEGLRGQSVRGEVVVLVGRAGAVDRDDADIRAALEEAMKTMRIKDAATTVAGALGLPRRQVYQVALTLGETE